MATDLQLTGAQLLPISRSRAPQAHVLAVLPAVTPSTVLGVIKPIKQLFWYAPRILAYDLMMATYGLVTRGEASHILGRKDGLMNWQFWWRKRMLIQSRRTMTSSDWEKIVLPIATPWAIRRRFRYLTRIGTGDVHG